MKTILLLGCGSKWGAELTKQYANQGYQVDLISGSNFSYPNVNTILVDWFSLTPELLQNIIPKKKYDLIFFNQNTGGGPNKKNSFDQKSSIDIGQWNHHIWINNQLPFFVVKQLAEHIDDTTKIGWMLTGLIIGSDPAMYQYAGYACVKSANLHIMRGFSVAHPGIFFAINPKWFPVEDYVKDAVQIIKVIDGIDSSLSGKVINKDGSIWL